MEGKGNHTLNLGQIQFYKPVIICTLLRLHCLKSFPPSVFCQILLCPSVCTPDTGKGSAFCSHYVNSYPIFHGKALNSWPHKLQNFILIKMILKGCLYQGQSHILRAYSWSRGSNQLHSNYRRAGNIIGSSKQLFYYLSSSFSNSHRSQGTVTSMAVRTQNHFSAACHLLSHVLVKYSPIRRNKDSSVFFYTAKTKYMVVFINGTANCT